MAKPWVASLVCSTLVMCSLTVSPSFTRRMSGVKWLRWADIQTSTTLPLRSTRSPPASIACGSGAIVRASVPGGYTSRAVAALQVDQLEVLRVQRADGRVAVDGPLVERHHVVVVRADRVPLGGGQVADVVVDRDRLDQCERLLVCGDHVLAQGELGDGAGQEHAGVAVALAVELGVEGPGAD